jgi:hypothetical protein
MQPDYQSQKQAELAQVIITYILRRGDGTEGSPMRIIRQVWSIDGKLIAEYDPEVQEK